MYVLYFLFFFFNDPATTEIYTLSLHDALPISFQSRMFSWWRGSRFPISQFGMVRPPRWASSPFSCLVCGSGFRSEEHTSELQSHSDLVCRLLLEKKKFQRALLQVYEDRDVVTS